MSNEQWKEGGDCSQCRRNKYCKKNCTAHNKAMNLIISSAVATKMCDHIFKKQKENNQ